MLDSSSPPVENRGFSAHLQEFQVEIVRRTSLAVVVFCGTAAWYSMSFFPFPLLGFLALVVMFGLGIFIRASAGEHPTRSRYLMLGLALLGPVVLMTTWPAPWIPFLTLPFVFVSSLTVDYGEWLSGACYAAAAGLLTLTGLRSYPLPAFLISISLTVALSWVVIYMVNQTLEWYESMLEGSNRLLHETRMHRGELSKVAKNLRLASELQRRTEQELIQARHSADEARLMKERFAARVSHELRTPLALINGFSEVMYSSPEIYGDVTWTATMRHDIAQIYQNSKHLLAMIDDILNLSRFEMAGFAIAMEDTHLTALLQETANIARDLVRNPNVRFETNIPPDLPVLKIDRTRIRQVILNLINNARRFTEAGFVRLTATASPQELTIQISDSGSGIPSDKLDLIFQEFYQVDDTLLHNKGGTGLGLTICKNFVEIHGGHIWVESEVDTGSVFSFSLPCTRVLSRANLPEITPGEPPAGNPKRVLSLRDDAHVLAMLRISLPGYEIISVDDDSLVHATALYHPRAVLQNLLPDSNARVVLPENLQIPLICYSWPSAHWLVERLGIQACLTKPVTNEVLVQELKRIQPLRRVLMIDDDTHFTQMVIRLLQSYNIDLDIQSAENGRAGLALASTFLPDLILVDLSMPEMDGFQLIEAAKQSPVLRDTTIVLLTAMSNPENLVSWKSNQVTIQRHGDLHAAETLNLVKACLDTLEPNFTDTTDDILIKLKL